MSIRWRKNGDLVCAAMSEEQDGDTYIDDGLHYRLSVEYGVIVADKNHKDNGFWHWSSQLLREALMPFSKLDLTGIIGGIVCQRNESYITIADVMRAREALGDKK